MDFASMNKTALRAACKDARISYGGMSNEQMRAALQTNAHILATDAEREAAQIAARAEHLASLGRFGEGETEEDAVCPHCGTNHFQNGYQTADSLTGDGVKHELEHQFVCLGCNGEWGPKVEAPAPKPTRTSKPTGTGLKIEKDRVERNGIKQPSVGGACRSVWDACSEMQALTPDVPLAVKQVKAHAVTMEWNENNAVIEFYRWRKWVAPTQAELEADLNAEGDPQDGAPAEVPEGYELNEGEVGKWEQTDEGPVWHPLQA